MKTILVLMDTLNRRYLKTYDEKAKGITPNMDLFARDCAVYENHLLALHHVCRQEEIFLQEECSFWKEAGEAWSRLTLRFRLCCGKKEFLPTSLPIIPIILKSAERITAICSTHGII